MQPFERKSFRQAGILITRGKIKEEMTTAIEPEERCGIVLILPSGGDDLADSNALEPVSISSSRRRLSGYISGSFNSGKE